MEKNPIETVKELSEGYSRQSKVANQMWLGLMISSIWVLTADKSSTNEAILPFSLGKVNEGNFLMGCSLIICLFTIAYCSAMIQTLRTTLLINRVIDSAKENEKFVSGVHIQDYVDSVISPTYSKVAPISQFLLGEKQFRGDQKKQSPGLRRVALVFYICLKFVSFGFTYLIPFYAVMTCYRLSRTEITIHLGVSTRE